MIKTVGEIIKNFKTEGACIKFSPKTIGYMASKLGYKKKRVGGKIGYHQSLITAISQHIREAVVYEEGLKDKVHQRRKKQPIETDYFAHNGERNNVDYEWEKNDDKTMYYEGINMKLKRASINESQIEDKNVLVGLWLDDSRHDPVKFLNKKNDDSESGAIVRNWYGDNMKGVQIQWTAVSNFWQFKKYIESNGVPDFVSLDHDLGKDAATKARKNVGGYEPNGADCALFLVSYCLRNGIQIPKNYIHSANDNKRVYISKAFRLGRMGKDPMEGVDLDNEQEFAMAADRFRASIMNPKVNKNLKRFMEKNSDSELGTADRLARIKGINNPEDLFKKNKSAFRENNNKINTNRDMNKKLIRLTESDIHRIVKESVSRILKEQDDYNHGMMASQNSIDQGYEYEGELWGSDGSHAYLVIDENGNYNVEDEDENLVFNSWFSDIDFENDDVIIGVVDGRRVALNWVTRQIKPLR